MSGTSTVSDGGGQDSTVNGEAEIERRAIALLRVHGDAARLVAAAEADTMLAGGDMESFATWMKILAWIDAKDDDGSPSTRH